MNWKAPFLLIRDVFYAGLADNVALLSAGIAFYSLISVAPLLVIAIAVAGFVFGQDAAQGELFSQLRELIGPQGAAAIQGLISRTQQTGSNVLATVIGVAVLLFGASRLFGALRFSLNTIWGVQARSDWGMVGMVKDRVSAFLMVLGTGFLLLVSLLMSTTLTVMTTYFEGWVPGAAIIWRYAELIVNFSLTVGVFTLLLQVVPDVVLAWRDALVGGVVTALLFSIGRYLISLYLGGGSFATVYGAAGSLVIMVFWIYYSAQILCFGAEFTKIYVHRFGHGSRLTDRVVYENAKARANSAEG